MIDINKIVIIINGKGGVGKDAFCEVTSRYYKVKTISSITPIKEIAKANGWNGKKDKKSRKFLSDLKRVFIEYNDLPNKYLLHQYRDFINDKETEILFVHIREADEIQKFKQQIECCCVSLLVENPLIDITYFGNDSDDLVNSMDYDYCFINDIPLSRMETKVVEFVKAIIDS